MQLYMYTIVHSILLPKTTVKMKNTNLNRTPEGTNIGDGVGGLTVAGEPLQALSLERGGYGNTH